MLKLVWHFIGVYIINRTLHGLLEIRIFSSLVEKYFTHSLRSLVKYTKRNFVSPRGHVISSISLMNLAKNAHSLQNDHWRTSN